MKKLDLSTENTEKSNTWTAYRFKEGFEPRTSLYLRLGPLSAQGFSWLQPVELIPFCERECKSKIFPRRRSGQEWRAGRELPFRCRGWDWGWYRPRRWNRCPGNRPGKCHGGGAIR